jgi:uncharacterized OsmC-like protein
MLVSSPGADGGRETAGAAIVTGGVAERPAGTPTAATYQVRARASASGAAHADAGTETITFDASWGNGPSGLPGPAELLAAAFAACLLKNLARCREFLSFSYEQAEADVTARRQDVPPKFTEITYELRLVTGEPQRRIDLLHRNLRRYGTVYNTLAAACDVHGRVIASPLLGPSSVRPDEEDHGPARLRSCSPGPAASTGPSPSPLSPHRR